MTADMTTCSLFSSGNNVKDEEQSISTEKVDAFLTDSLIGVLSEDYDYKVQSMERMKKCESWIAHSISFLLLKRYL